MYREKIRKALEAKRAEAQKVWGEFETLRDVISGDGFDPTKDSDSEAFKAATEKNREYASLKAEVDGLFAKYEAAVDMDGEKPLGDSPFGENKGREDGGEAKSLSAGDVFLKSDQFKALRESGVLESQKSRVAMNPVQALNRDQVKTLLTGEGAPGTELLRPTRLPGIMPLLQAPLQMQNLITVGTTDANEIEWVRVLAIANNAAEVEEATATTGASGTKPESGFTYEIESARCQTIAHWIPATKQALQDMAGLRTQIDSVLLDGIARRLNSQILNGDGSTPNLNGILNQASGSQTFSVSVLETILRAITSVRLSFFNPTAILMNPLDWVDIRLTRDAGGASANTGQYLFGPPSQAGVSTLWGLPVIEDALVTQGAPIIADWKQAILYIRDGVTIVATDSHEDFFVRNMIAILAEGRYCVAVPRPEAFCVADITA